jgi:hypothetical protein
VPDTEAEAAGCDAVQAHAQQQQQARQEGGQKRKPAAAAGGRDVVAGGEQEQHAGSAGEDEGGIAAGPGVEEEEEELEDELAALAERLSQATIRGAPLPRCCTCRRRPSRCLAQGSSKGGSLAHPVLDFACCLPAQALPACPRRCQGRRQRRGNIGAVAGWRAGVDTVQRVSKACVCLAGQL